MDVRWSTEILKRMLKKHPENKRNRFKNEVKDVLFIRGKRRTRVKD